MSLTRKWWRRRRRRRGGGEGEEDDDDDDGGDPFSLPSRDDLQPIDTLDQEEMVRSFERKYALQSLVWRRVFAGFILGYAGFMMYSIFHQVWFPWELRYHAYFMEDVQLWMVLFADSVAVVACLLAVKGLLHASGSSKQWLWYSSYAALLVAVFWLYYILRLPKFRWDIIWLPFAPLSGAAMCLYVDNLLRESLEDVSKLRSYMYNYKAL
ncbi:hypothetical protein ACMD2_01886 [Ananas comosus]|uniref:Uncharacterized protein n=1 Tax=Ananas comosus TaxID=4615 RepID=A0A199VE66_ANACO|nr:hypothetical protein ACMD2_01886 [Ananas comosus]